jgi:ribosomal protein S6
MQYEINYLVLQSKTPQLPEIRTQAKTMIEAHGAKITAEKNYLKRKLAYEIKHENYGFYTVLRFELKNGEPIEELKKELNLKPEISRYIIVRAEELPPIEDTLKKEEIQDTIAAQTEQEKPVAEKPAVKEEQPAPIEPTETTEEKEETAAAVEPTAEETAPEKIEAPVAKKEKVKAEKPEKKTAEKDEKEPAKEKKEEAAAKKKDQEKASIEDLDKKLDEILNI